MGKEIALVVKDFAKIDFKELAPLPDLKIKHRDQEIAWIRVQNNFDEINKNIKRRDELVSIIEDAFWRKYQYTFGIFFLILAFGLRLTLVSYKLNQDPG